MGMNVFNPLLILLLILSVLSVTLADTTTDTTMSPSSTLAVGGTIRLDIRDNENKTTQKEAFAFERWGYFNGIDFDNEPYFAGYVLEEEMPADDQILYQRSGDECSLCQNQLQKILVNSDEKIASKDRGVKLKDGYELIVKGINDLGQGYLELQKNGKTVDEDVKCLFCKDFVTLLDTTYYYKTDVGNQKDLVIIAVHFKTAYEDEKQSLVIVNGIWQISDSAEKFGKFKWVKINDSWQGEAY
jgi:hypothetical protein